MSTDATTADGFRVGRRVRVTNPLSSWHHLECEIIESGMGHRRWLVQRDNGEEPGILSETDMILLPEPDAPATPEPAQADDVINKAPHYNAGGIECIDAIKAALTPEEFRGYLKGNVFKYGWRERHKGGVESLRKARWYLDKLIGESATN